MRRVVTAAIALLLSSCTYVVGGDSTMSQVGVAIGQEEPDGNNPQHAEPGCGWTGDFGIPGPCVVPLNPVDDPAVDKVILGVSIWDFRADDLSGYLAAQDYYEAQGLWVGWAAVPPIENEPAGLWTNEHVDNLNAAVADFLGCDLIPAWVRDAATTDGIHYTTSGAITVAARFQLVGEEWAC